MCGIAGYNCSPDVAAEFGQDRFSKIISGTWLRNVHRGTDAHGYMAGRLAVLDELEADIVEVNKYEGSAEESVRQGRLPAGKPVNMGIHTRAATTGAPQDNENNHPVESGNVLVTHNGMVDPIHHYFRDRDLFPEVDSFYIAFTLDAFDDPLDWNFKEVLSSIEANIHGGFAFHAMWKNVPGLSLIVRGARNPLITAWNEDRGVFLYASEEDAVAFQMEKFGMHPGQFEYGEVDEGFALLMYAGEILEYGIFNPAYSFKEYANRSNIFRMNHEGEMIRRLTTDKDFEDRSIPMSLFMASDYQKESIFPLEEGAHDLIDRSLKSEFTELSRRRIWTDTFDHKYVYIPGNLQTLVNKSVRYFFIRNEEEFILNDTFALIDIIDWAKFNENEADPYVEVEDKKEPLVLTKNEMDFNEFYATSKSNKFVTMRDDWKGVGVGNFTRLGAHGMDSWGSEVFSDLRIKRLRLLDTTLNREMLTRHTLVPDLVFIGDPQCALHNGKIFSAHEYPQECPVLMNCAKMVLASTRDLDDMIKLYNVTTIQHAGNENCQHVWYPFAYKTIRIDTNLKHLDLGESFAFPYSEKCTLCEGKSTLDPVPDVFGTLHTVVYADEVFQDLETM